MTYPRIFAAVAAWLAAVPLLVALLPGPQPLVGTPASAAPTVAACDTTGPWTVNWTFTNTTGQPLIVVDDESVFGYMDLSIGQTVTVAVSYPASYVEPILNVTYGVPAWGYASTNVVAHRTRCGKTVNAVLAP